MKILGKTGAIKAIEKTDATVPAGKNLTEAYKTLANIQKENNTSEVVKQVFQQYRDAGLSK